MGGIRQVGKKKNNNGDEQEAFDAARLTWWAWPKPRSLARFYQRSVHHPCLARDKTSNCPVEQLKQNVRTTQRPRMVRFTWRYYW